MEYTVTNNKENVLGLQNKFFTNNQSANLSLEAISNELEALSFSISHDLRAPLRVIHNNCELLSNKHEELDEKIESTILQQIIRSSEQMEKLLDGLLAFSKSVKSAPKHALIDMNVLVKNVVNELMEFEATPSAYSITLQPLLSAYGDEMLIHQVWYNLLSNAFKFTRKTDRKEIEVISSLNNNEIVYCVKDNGVGFDMQYINNLFGVFHRLHEVEEFEGIGVGLAIVKRIIMRHGGHVWAEGKVDKGAQFYFTLPKA